MALNYRPVDRDQPFLLPPDLRDWLPPDHLAWFILEVIERLDTRVLHRRSKRGGTGRAGYDPEMLLGLWVYASARGISSSRQIERACLEDVAFRVLCAQDAPDHTVLARFRQDHQDAMAGLFAQVLALCVGQGLGRFGVIAIDGTKIRANASMDKSVSLKRLRQLAAAQLATAEATDAAEDAAGVPAAGDDLPPGMGPGSDRSARIAAAIADLEQLIEAENTPEITKYEHRLGTAKDKLAKAEEVSAAHLRRAADALAAGRRRSGRQPVPDSVMLRRLRATVANATRRLDQARSKAAGQLTGQVAAGRKIARRNTTDPQSRIMKTRKGFIQGYNAQLAVSDDGLIIAAYVTDDGNDQHQLIPAMAQTVAMTEHCERVTGRTDLAIGTVLADNGYLSQENLDAPGPGRLIAPGRGKIRDGQWAGKLGSVDGRGPGQSALVMLAKLEDPANQTLYKRRSVTVEPVNGHVKDRRGLRQFARRGHAAVDAELVMACLTTNLMKLFTTTWRPAQTTP